MEMTRGQFFLYVVIAQVIIGALIGLIPFFLGRKRGQPRLGTIGWIATVAGGIVSVLVSVVVAAIFSWVIVRRHNESAPPPETPGEPS